MADTSHIPRINDDEIERCYNALKAANIDPTSASRGDISRTCGLGDRRARTIRNKFRSGWVPEAESPFPEGRSDHIGPDGTWTVSISGSHVKSKEDLIQELGIDLTEWEIVNFKSQKHSVPMKPPATTEWATTRAGTQWPAWVREDGRVLVVDVWKIEASFKPKVAVRLAAEELADIKATLKANAPMYPLINRSLSSGLMVQVNPTDHHFAKLAHGDETLYGHYDLKIATDCWREALGTTLERTRVHKPDRFLLILGNDLFNYDNLYGTTAKGTPQAMSSDSRLPHVFKTVRELCVETILQYRKIAPVDVTVVKGNHDESLVFMLGDALECWFHATDDVTINNAPSPRKYFRWGTVGLMFWHGDKNKRAEYPLLFASERPDLWAATTWREIHTGDKHQTRTERWKFRAELEENKGVRVRILPSLCEPDAWHSDSGYVGNLRSMESFIWHSDEGLVGTSVYSPPRRAA